jgi:hypothetical protein
MARSLIRIFAAFAFLFAGLADSPAQNSIAQLRVTSSGQLCVPQGSNCVPLGSIAAGAFTLGAANIPATLPSGLAAPNWAIAPPAGLGAGLTINQTLTGTPSGGAYFPNPITINFGALVNPKQNSFAFGPSCNVTSSSINTPVSCLASNLDVTATNSAAVSPNNAFVSNINTVISSIGTTSNGAGLFAGNDVVNLSGSGSGWGIFGREIDVLSTQTNTNRIGLFIGGSATTLATVADAAISVVSAPAGGWGNLILADASGLTNGVAASPVAPSGCLVCTKGSATIATGVDLSSFDVTGFEWHSGHFAVNGGNGSFVGTGTVGSFTFNGETGNATLAGTGVLSAPVLEATVNTQSTSVTTGSGIFAGGIGVAGNGFFGGLLNVVNGGAIGGSMSFVGATNATSTATGTVTDSGGLGIAKDFWFGGALFSSQASAPTIVANACGSTTQ